MEHFHYPSIFIRRTKKGFISVADKDIIEIAKSAQLIEYKQLWKYLNDRNLQFTMKNCRKIHGTYLKKQGLDVEIVDLLEGRLPKGVFLRFYNRPNFKHECERVRIA